MLSSTLARSRAISRVARSSSFPWTLSATKRQILASSVVGRPSRNVTTSHRAFSDSSKTLKVSSSKTQEKIRNTIPFLVGGAIAGMALYDAMYPSKGDNDLKNPITLIRSQETLSTGSKIEESVEVAPIPTSHPPISSNSFDREATLDALRSFLVKELRTECAQRSTRRANMTEQEDLIQALLQARKKSSNFSPSGALTPGEVADINDQQLTTELKAGDASTPLLLTVYATWCGHCQMMSPQLSAAATELGDSVRVAKIDSDKCPNWASRLRVRGVPTVILFDGATGKEVQRVEGALMKDGLVELARSHM